MSPRVPTFTIGIEEEYLLIDPVSRDVVADPPQEIFTECAAPNREGVVEPELLRSQIEVETRVSETVGEARTHLVELRRLASTVAARHGLAIMAASTHPFAEWHVQRTTDKQRYHTLYRDMQALARRLFICGMHVHVGIADDELRVQLLNQFRPFLPLLLALSTSSPFWEGENSGLKSYRTTVFDNFPRSGLPESFADYADYQRHIDILTRSGVMDDATFIWWDMRISARYPTLECRVMDICTRLQDAIAIAALIQSLLHWLCRMQRDNAARQLYSRFLVDQNRWRAIRYGLDAGLVDFTTERIVPVADLLEDAVATVYPDAEILGCAAELEQILEIPRRGTSAHRQLETYVDAIGKGKSTTEALHAVVDMLVQETLPE
ncbi:MAG: carboxylate-amine ligase [Gammaproteobacteria bacterium]